LLFEFARDRAAVVRTGQHSSKGNIVFLVTGLVVTIENSLNGFE